jgi:hypothetical protein
MDNFYQNENKEKFIEQEDNLSNNDLSPLR